MTRKKSVQSVSSVVIRDSDIQEASDTRFVFPTPAITGKFTRGKRSELLNNQSSMGNFSPVRKIGPHWVFLTGEKNRDAMELLIELEIFYLLKTGKFTIK